MRRQNPTLHRLTALAICLLLCAACALGGGKAETPSPTITLVTAVPVLTYTNPTYGYSVDYPPAARAPFEQIVSSVRFSE